jgi:phage FluMu protein Com
MKIIWRYVLLNIYLPQIYIKRMNFKQTEDLSTPDYIRTFGKEPNTVRCKKCGTKLFEYCDNLSGDVRIKCKRCRNTYKFHFSGSTEQK